MRQIGDGSLTGARADVSQQGAALLLGFRDLGSRLRHLTLQLSQLLLDLTLNHSGCIAPLININMLAFLHRQKRVSMVLGYHICFNLPHSCQCAR